MVKTSGLGDNFYIAGYNVSGEVSSLTNISGPRGLLDVTAIDKSAVERIGGLRDGQMGFNTWLDVATDKSHDALSTLKLTDRIFMYFRGTTLGNPTACMVAKQGNYDWTRAGDAAISASVAAQANAFGLDWGQSLTAGQRTDTSATNGSSIDLTDVTTLFGAVAYLNVFAFTGTSCTVAIHDSANDSDFTLIAGMTFTAATARTEERITSTSVTGTVRRYIRAVTTGTFSNCVFAVGFTRYLSTQG